MYSALDPSGSTPAASLSADPHPALWAEWQRSRDLYNGPDLIAGSPEGEAVHQELERLGQLLCSTVALTAEGLAAQFEYLTGGILEDGCDAVVEIVVPALDVFLTELDGLDEF